MCPDIDWSVDDDFGEHTVVKTAPNNRSRRRRIALGVVILLGVSLGAMYSSIPGPALPPTIAVRLTPTSGPSDPHVLIALPTVTLSPNSSNSALYPVSASVSSPLTCSFTVGSAWRLWRSEGHPYAVRALLTDQGQLWAGTASGLYDVDPRTDQYAPALPYETTGGISMLLPLGDDRLWVEGDLGHFYYDARLWSRVWISESKRPANGHGRNRSTWRFMDRTGDTGFKMAQPISPSRSYPAQRSAVDSDIGGAVLERFRHLHLASLHLRSHFISLDG